jgi:hypothetical protein
MRGCGPPRMAPPCYGSISGKGNRVTVVMTVAGTAPTLWQVRCCLNSSFRQCIDVDVVEPFLGMLLECLNKCADSARGVRQAFRTEAPANRAKATVSYHCPHVSVAMLPLALPGRTVIAHGRISLSLAASRRWAVNRDALSRISQISQRTRAQESRW